MRAFSRSRLDVYRERRRRTEEKGWNRDVVGERLVPRGRRRRRRERRRGGGREGVVTSREICSTRRCC